ncbi:MAG: TatD family hydrolase [Turneriella sp.]|nr:TatD family hydrolase [Turneriella sp.]
MLIDFHCHIDLYPNPKLIVDNIIQRQVRTLSVTTTPSAWKITNSLSHQSEFIRTSLGLHPQLAGERYSELALFENLLQDNPFIGEIGLDGSKESKHTLESQLKVFRHILWFSKKSGGRILSIHSRLAAAQTISELSEFRGAGVAVFHWFSGSLSELEAAIQLGSWFSIGHSMLGSKKGRELVRRMPRNRILTETDGPFTSIGSNSAKPWDVRKAISGLGEVWRLPNDDVNAQLGINFDELTKGAWNKSRNPV